MCLPFSCGFGSCSTQYNTLGPPVSKQNQRYIYTMHTCRSYLDLSKTLNDPCTLSNRIWIRLPAGWLENVGSISGMGSDFSLQTTSNQLQGKIQPPVQQVLEALFLGVKQPGCGMAHSLLSSDRLGKMKPHLQNKTKLHSDLQCQFFNFTVN